jgi:hypothetical protein
MGTPFELPFCSGGVIPVLFSFVKRQIGGDVQTAGPRNLTTADVRLEFRSGKAPICGR